jgi:hypothetical protein
MQPTEPVPSADASDNSGGNNEPPGRFDSLQVKVAIVTASIAAVGAIVAAAVTGVFGLLGPGSRPGPVNSGTANPTAGCPGSAVSVQVPGEVESQATVTFRFFCAPAKGFEYLRIIEALKVGRPSHTEYYPKQFAVGVRANTTVNLPLDVSGDKVGQQNCIVVYSVTISEAEQILDNLNSHNLTLQLPSDIDQVSNRACETRTS